MFREYRKRKGLTQEQLAEKLNLSTRQLQRIEKDESKTTVQTLKKLRTALEIPDEDMIQVLYEKQEKTTIKS